MSYATEWIAKRRAAGLCPGCPSPAATGRKYCGGCLERRRTNQKALTAKRKKEGVCCLCGRDKEGERGILCPPCAAKNRKNIKERRARAAAQGMCRQCFKKEPASGRRSCLDCLVRQRKRKGPA